MNKILFFLLVLFFTQNGYAQSDTEPVLPASEVYTDSLGLSHYANMLRADSVLLKKPVSENQIYPKKFKENLQSRYRGNEFDYSTSKPRESFGQKLMRKVAKILESIFGKTAFSSSAKGAEILVRLFAIVLVGFLLYIIVKFLLGKDGNFIFGKKNKKVDIAEEELHENIHEINFPESILIFEKSHDYRSAVRYQFLYVLKKLSDKKMISWNPEKTNKDYEKELKSAPLKSDFSALSYIFEYVWYGEFSIDEENYLKFKTQYQSFKP